MVAGADFGRAGTDDRDRRPDVNRRRTVYLHAVLNPGTVELKFFISQIEQFFAILQSTGRETSFEPFGALR